MTTIAYRDGILAADTQLTLGSMISAHVPKIFNIRGVLVAAGGASIICQRFVDWIRAGMDPEQCPAMSDGDKEGESMARGLIIHGGRIIEYTKWGFLSLPDQPYAIGSGYEFATAAMKMGATAEEAVRLACELDIYSGGQVVTVRASK